MVSLHHCLHPLISVRTPQRSGQDHKQKTVELQSPFVLRPSLMCVCVCSIFSCRGADVLGLAGEKVLGHRQAGEQRTHTCWLSHFIHLCFCFRGLMLTLTLTLTIMVNSYTLVNFNMQPCGREHETGHNLVLGR